MTTLPTKMVVHVSDVRVGDMVMVSKSGWRQVVSVSNPLKGLIGIAYDGGIDVVPIEDEIPILRQVMPPEVC